VKFWKALAVVSLVVGCVPHAVVAQHTAWSDPTPDRGFLVAKGTTLSQGRGYVAAVMPGALDVAYGVSDRFTVMGGTVPWTVFQGPFIGFGSLRYGVVQSEWVDLAIGAFGAMVAEHDEFDAAVWPFVSTTVGSPTLSVTGLVGAGSNTSIIDGDLNNHLLLQGEAEWQVASQVKVIAEALYLGEGYDPIGGAGLRFWARPGMIELGVAREFTGSGSSWLPWVALAYGF